jgi:hypothetical protein
MLLNLCLSSRTNIAPCSPLHYYYYNAPYPFNNLLFPRRKLIISRATECASERGETTFLRPLTLTYIRPSPGRNDVFLRKQKIQLDFFSLIFLFLNILRSFTFFVYAWHVKHKARR